MNQHSELASTAQAPRLTIESPDFATDGAFHAIADVSRVLDELQIDSRLIGGTAVMLHARALDIDRYRFTADVDIGVKPMVLRNGHLVAGIEKVGYVKTAGNRWERHIDERRTASIDVLVPAYRTRARSSVQVGSVNTTEVPGLAEVSQRSGTQVEVTLIATDDVTLHARVSIPDEVGVLILKAHARSVRNESRDAHDLLTCLLIVQAGGKLEAARSDPAVAEVMPRLRREFSESGAALGVVTHGLPGEEAARVETIAQLILAAIDPQLE